MNIKIKLEKYLMKNQYPEGAFIGVLPVAKKMMGSARCEEAACYEESGSIGDYIDKEKEEDTFQTKLFQLIDSKNLKDSDVYNKVNMDRRLFSKIRSDREYHPSKETILLLGIALECSEEEIEDLLKSASYSLPKNSTYDLILRFCFKEHIYNLSQINEFLYDHNCKLLNN